MKKLFAILDEINCICVVSRRKCMMVADVGEYVLFSFVFLICRIRAKRCFFEDFFQFHLG